MILNSNYLITRLLTYLFRCFIIASCAISCVRGSCVFLWKGTSLTIADLCFSLTEMHSLIRSALTFDLSPPCKA